jgi:hypothetical protein
MTKLSDRAASAIPGMEEKPRQRWFSFRLRTLLVFVVLASSLAFAFSKYALDWKRQREAALVPRNFEHNRTWVVHEIGFGANPPLALRLFGAAGFEALGYVGDNDGLQQARAMFPEAIVYRIRTYPIEQ